MSVTVTGFTHSRSKHYLPDLYIVQVADEVDAWGDRRVYQYAFSEMPTLAEAIAVANYGQRTLAAEYN